MDHERAVGETAKLGWEFGWASGALILGNLAIVTPEPLSKLIFGASAAGMGYLAYKAIPEPAYADRSRGASRLYERASQWGQGHSPALAAAAA